MGNDGVVPQAGTVRFERTVPGPVERVWAHLTDPELRATWLAGGITEPHVGGRIDHVFRVHELVPAEPTPAEYAADVEHHRYGHVLVYDAPTRLAFTWVEAGHRESEVHIELAPDTAVTLRLEHAHIPTRDELVSVAAAWHTHLDILEARLKNTVPESFWGSITRLQAHYEREIPAHLHPAHD